MKKESKFGIKPKKQLTIEEKRRSKILFIDASFEYEEGKAQNFLREKHISKIVDAFDCFSDIDKFCNVISIEDIIENDYNLNVSLYVDTSNPEPDIDVNVVNKDLKGLIEAREKSYKEMQGYLKELGYCDG